MYSNVQRVTSGAINAVNDAAIGQLTGQSFGPSGSKFAGQLGKVFEAQDDELISDLTNGRTTVYGGQFQYVRLDPSAGPVALGQAVYWDVDADLEDYQVTDDGSKTTLVNTLMAGVVLNPLWEAGNYSWIQIAGLVTALFDASITGTAAVGRPVFLDSTTEGVFDVLDTVDGPGASRLVGTAYGLPVAGQASLVFLDPKNLRR